MMASSALRILVPGLLLPTLMAHAGGWAVITVQDLPDYVEAGKRIDLSYMVRQHGQTPLDQLRGSIEATSGRLTATGMVVPGARPGSYAASITLPSAGDWSITIRSGFGRSDVTLLPLAAVEHGAALTRPVTDPERGRRLFVSKGCVTCHEQIEVGPSSEASDSTSHPSPASWRTRHPRRLVAGARRCRTSDSSSARSRHSCRF